jgi:hypothetical protein
VVAWQLLMENFALMASITLYPWRSGS